MIMVRVQSCECSFGSVDTELVARLRGYDKDYLTITQPLCMCNWIQNEPFGTNSGHYPPHWTPDL